MKSITPKHDNDGFSKTFATSTTDALIEIDSSGNVLLWNKAASIMFGYEESEVIGKPVRMIIPERFKKSHDQGIKRVNGNGEKHVIGRVVELAGLRKDGTEFPIELTLSTWDSPEGRFYGGIIRDITSRVAIENELRSSESRHRAITEAANDAIITANSQGLILSWNMAAEKTFGYKSDEVVGQSLTIIIPDEYRSSHEEGIKRVAGGGEQHVIGKTVELSGLHKDGHFIPIELTLSTWKIGEQRFFSGIIRDISQRKFMEELHQAIELKFKSIAESASDAIISANDVGEIQSWNKAAENIFGYSESEVLGGPLTIIIPEEYRELHQKGIERVARGGRQNVIGHTVELTGLHKNGAIIPIELSLSTWKTKNQVYYSGIIRDITERKNVEKKVLEQKDKLAKKTKDLKRLNKDIKEKNDQLQAISNKLAKYLSRQVYDNIFQGKQDVKIESYRKKLTVFFSDIYGFTEMTDKVESEVLTSALNKYLNEMSSIAIKYGGTIDKYIGDAIMIFFGDPDSRGEREDALACARMAIEMKRKLKEMREHWGAMGISTPIRVRMGINTGYCTVGNFGSDERLDYTIVGSAVNLASRLEALAEVDEILISENTYSLIQDQVKCVLVNEVKVKGMAYPIMTYNVVDFFDAINKKEEEIHARIAGFDLSIEFNKLQDNEKKYAREMLEKAILKLQESQD